ncbi:MAG: ATPase AAA-2 protein, partial [uncultured bacterium]
MSTQGGSASSGKRPNFIRWYYVQGVQELLGIWKNFLLFVWRHFSISELACTLFSPWRRDVSASNWRGLHPLKALKLFFGNTISRLLGAFVRTFVIGFGLLFFLIVALVGIILNVLWIGAPLIASTFIFYAFKFDADLLSVGGSLFVWMIAVIFFYYYSTKKSMLLIGMDQLLKNHVFKRVCARLGIARKRFPEELFGNKELFDEFLKARNLTEGEYLQILQWELARQQNKVDSKKFWRLEFLEKIPAIGRQWRYGYTVNLDRYCLDLSKRDFTEYADAELIGRADEHEVLRLVLERSNQNCALLVGNAGIGRKTLIHSLARSIRLNQEDRELSQTRILLFDLGRVISDTVNDGLDVENFLRVLFSEACRAGNVVLIIEHLEHFLAEGANAFHSNIASVLEEFLHIPTFRIVATSTSKEYHQLIE